MDYDSMADFLLSRRRALTPQDVGLPGGLRRRVRGLRREEVAHLSHMSMDYYTRLEQSRASQPSGQMLAALARALRLDPEERDHLYRLAGAGPSPDGTRTSDVVRPALIDLLDQLDDSAAFICSDLLVMLAQNRLSVLLMGNHVRGNGIEDSVIWRWFTDPSYRTLFAPEDRESQAALHVADLRATSSRRRGDPDVEAIVNGLSCRSEEFQRLWKRHEVGRPLKEVQKIIMHPRVGPVPVDVEILSTADEGHRLVVLSAPAGTDSRRKFELLGKLGDQAIGA
jgi:transcriptional regulator with XRE-family HTH domain